MTDKKWYENIPKNGVLCKVAADDAQFVYIRDTHDLAEFCCDYAADETILTPITPTEWWNFAPWQDIKEAKGNEKVFLLFSDGFMTVDRPDYTKIGYGGLRVGAIKFLPLPEESQ